MTGALVVKQLSSLDEIGGEDWNRLVASCPDATCFQLYEWLTAWWDVFGADADTAIFAACRDGVPVAIAPMYRDAGNLRFIGEPHSDYNLFIWKASEQDAIDLLLQEILATPDIAEIHFEEIPAGCMLAKKLRALRNIRLRKLHSTQCPRLVCSRQNIDWALGKKSVRRGAAKLKKYADIRVAHLTDRDAIAPYLQDFYDQHIRRWARTDYPSLFARTENRDFYERLLENGWPVLFTVVTADDRPVAFHYGGFSGHDLVWYKPSFDVDMAAYSPGEYLLASLIEYADTNGLAGLDYTRGREAFKLRFSTEVNRNINMRYYSSVTRALVYGYTRDMLRSLKRSKS